MPLEFAPPIGCLVVANFDRSFKAPEMVKPRLAVVISPAVENRFGLCTIVPLSTTPPDQVMPYHAKIVIPFQLPPKWGNRERWVKGDMVYAAGFHRLDLLRLGKDRAGRRIYQMRPLPTGMITMIQHCVLHGLGMGALTEHLK